MWQLFLLNLGIGIVEKVIENTTSKHDDKILEITKKGASYLAGKDNNTVPYTIGAQIANAVMKE